MSAANARRASGSGKPLPQEAVERQVWRAFFDAMRMVMPVAPGGVRLVTGETFAGFDLPTIARGPRSARVSPR